MPIIGAVLLAADVGNTQTHVGVFDGSDLIEHWRVATEAEETAKLPPIELGEPLGESSVIGRSTQASLQSGIVYGFAGAVDAIARRVQRELGADTDFIATGGQAHAIIPYSEMVDEIDDLL